MSTKKYLIEITSILKQHAETVSPVVAKKRKQIYNTQLDVLGLTIPILRTINKKGFSFYKEEDKKVLTIWEHIWNTSSIFEVKVQALLYYETQRKSLSIYHWEHLLKWVNGVDNWEHSDRLSNMFSCFLEKNPKKIFPILQSWNTHNNSWHRRQSIVSLIYYSHCREKNISWQKISTLVKNLLRDDDVYVQKGVGWTLREAGNIYPEEVLVFITKNLKDISSIAFTSSLEKVDKKTKERLKEIRKEHRKAN